MIAVALKGLAGRKVRALLTALAIVIGVTPAVLMFSFSPASTLRSAMSTPVRPSTEPRSSIGKGSPASPNATTKGIPCTFPDGEVFGVLLSPCASIQITPGRRPPRAIPARVPMAIE